MLIFAILLFFLFLVLQVTGQIEWDAVWISAPLWGVLVMGLCVVVQNKIWGSEDD